MSDESVSNGANGEIRRDAQGKFMRGTAPGPGNPHVQKLATWRAALSDAISPEDVRAVLKKLVKAAKGGAPWAVKELLDRVLGKSVQSVVADVHQHAAPVMSEEDQEVARQILSRRLGPSFRPAASGDGHLGTLLPSSEEPEP